MKGRVGKYRRKKGGHKSEEDWKEIKRMYGGKG